MIRQVDSFNELRKRLVNYIFNHNTIAKENLVRDLNNAAWVLQKAGMIKCKCQYKNVQF